MTTQILATIGALVLIVQAATLIPGALTELLRSSRRAVLALRELRNALDPHTRSPAASQDTPRHRDADGGINRKPTNPALDAAHNDQLSE
ncbi:hypothetical protein [Nocardia barduliensis]|uniref:hypothetical protein n=1 Tax=Nocardia barduliensis TaxID=2736643 RepID=UPI001571DAC6|nr:hypothetical protein [Nocardia barduliensis]